VLKLIDSEQEFEKYLGITFSGGWIGEQHFVEIIASKLVQLLDTKNKLLSTSVLISLRNLGTSAHKVMPQLIGFIKNTKGILNMFAIMTAVSVEPENKELKQFLTERAKQKQLKIKIVHEKDVYTKDISEKIFNYELFGKIGHALKDVPLEKNYIKEAIIKIINIMRSYGSNNNMVLRNV